MDKIIDIKMIIEIPSGVTVDDVVDVLLDITDSKGWECGIACLKDITEECRDDLS